MFLLNLIKNHWTVVPPVKTPEQEARERKLFLVIPGIPFSRWWLFFAAFMIQFCCGSLYAWSVFNTPIDVLIYKDALAGQAVNSFYIAVACFGFTALIMGPWLERNGPRKGVWIGATMFLIGKSIAAISLSYRSMAGTYIGYGVFCGFGLGLNYICPVSALQKWFPDYRGVASGFAVGGFGAGSVVWAQVYLPLVAKVGLPAAFAVIGAMFFGTFLMCSVILRTPTQAWLQEMNAKLTGTPIPLPGAVSDEQPVVIDPPYDKSSSSEKDGKQQQQLATEMAGLAGSSGVSKEQMEISSSSAAQEPADGADVPRDRQWTLIEAISSPDYWFLYVLFFANELFGLVALSRLSNMATELFGKTKAEGANLVAINGVFNCCGRLVFPMMSDLIYNNFSAKGKRFSAATARKTIFLCALLGQVVIVSMAPSLIDSKNYNGFRGAMWVLTALYGAGFGTIPAFLANMWGPTNVGALHGMILTAWSIGGVGGGFGFTANYKHFKKDNIRLAYEYNFKWILAVLVVGLVCLFFVRTNPEERNQDGYYFSFLGRKVFHIKGKKREEAKLPPPAPVQQAGGSVSSLKGSTGLRGSAGLRKSTGFKNDI